MRGSIGLYHPASSYETIKAILGPVDFWPCQETSGTTLVNNGSAARNLATTGSPSLAQPGPGTLLAIGFDGATQYATTTTTQAYAGDYTIGCWAYRTASGANTPISMTSAGVAAATAFNAPFAWQFVMSSSGGGDNYFLVNSPSAVVNNTWYHVAVTFQVTSPAVLMYVNGALVTTSTATSGTRDTGAVGASLGRFYAANPHYFAGRVTQAFIANGLATAAQIAAIYQAGLS